MKHNAKIHDEQNINILNEDRINITDFSFRLRFRDCMEHNAVYQHCPANPRNRKITNDYCFK